MPVKAKKKAVLYIRVSTEEQAKEGVSISAQEERLKAFAIAKDYEIADVLIDDGYSGKDFNRPKIKKLLNPEVLREIDVVAVMKVDRLSRKLTDFLDLFETLQDNNVAFVCVTEGFDTGQASGRMMMHILAVFAEYERDLISERTKPVGCAPYGFRVGEKPGDRVEIKSELKQVEKIFKLALKGMGPRAISERTRVDVTKIRRILLNPIYNGKVFEKGERNSKGKPVPFEERGELIDAPWAKRIVDTDDWLKIQRMFHDRRRGPYYDTEPAYELTGLIRCSKCSGAFVITRDKKGIPYLRCAAKYRKAKGCSEATIGYKKALNLVYELTRDILADEGYDLSAVDIDSDLGTLHRDEAELNNKRQRFFDAYSEGYITAKDLKAQIGPLDTKLAEIRTKVAEVEWEDARTAWRPDFVKYADVFEQAVESGDYRIVNDFLKALWPTGIRSKKIIERGKCKD